VLVVVRVVGSSLLGVLVRVASCMRPSAVLRVLGVRCCSQVVALRCALRVVVRLVTVVVGVHLRAVPRRHRKGQWHAEKRRWQPC
jgi:hypothetical protein